MGDRILPNFKLKDPTKDLSFGQSLGVSAEFKIGFPIKTAISEGDGLILGGALKLELPDTFAGSHGIYLQYLSGTSTGNSVETDSEHWNFQIAGGSKKDFYSFFDNDGDYRIGLARDTRPLLGIGKTTIGNPYNGFASNKHTFDIGTETGAVADIMIVNRLRGSIGVGGYYGVDFVSSGSQYNRLKIAIMINAELAWSSASLHSEGNADVALSPLADVFEFLKLIHGGVFRYAMNATLTDQQELLEDYGLSAGGGGPGPFQDLKYFRFGSTFLGGLGDSSSSYLRSYACWGYFGVLLARGITFTALPGDAGKTGGIGDLLGTAKLGGYAIAGIHTIEKRADLSDDEIIRREEWVNFGSYLLNSIFTAAGQGADLDMISQAGAAATIPIGMNPGIVSELTKRMDIMAGASLVDPRFAINIHRDWKDLPLFSSLTVFLAGSDKDIELHSSLGLKYKWRYVRLLGGLDNDIFFGDKPGAHAGAMAGLDFLIPFDDTDSGAGISTGARCFVNFAGDYDCAMLGGATF